MKLKMKVTIEFEYETNSEWYPESVTPEQMAKVDQDNFNEDPGSIVDLIGEPETKIIVTPTEVERN